MGRPSLGEVVFGPRLLRRLRDEAENSLHPLLSAPQCQSAILGHVGHGITRNPRPTRSHGHARRVHRQISSEPEHHTGRTPKTPTAPLASQPARPQIHPEPAPCQKLRPRQKSCAPDQQRTGCHGHARARSPHAGPHDGPASNSTEHVPPPSPTSQHSMVFRVPRQPEPSSTWAHP